MGGDGQNKGRGRGPQEERKHARQVNAARAAEGLASKSTGSVSRFKARALAHRASIDSKFIPGEAIGPPAVRPPPPPKAPTDLLEVFAGKAVVSHQFRSWGWNTAEPIDLNTGYDLRDECARQCLLDWIQNNRPRLVIVAYPCRLWSIVTNMQYSTGQERRRLQKLRERERCPSSTCVKIFSACS